MKKEAAFSGLEAAIVLIAFVVVAAVFSYVMLGAGFFATQKSQEVTYSGVKQSTSNIVLDGQLYGVMSDTKLTSLKFYLMIPEGGQPQSLVDLVYLMTVKNGEVKTMTGTYSGDTVLAPGDRREITINVSSYSSTNPSITGGPAAGESFTLEIKPKVGASTLIAKTLATGYNGGVII
jgi:flagellin FlaB